MLGQTAAAAPANIQFLSVSDTDFATAKSRAASEGKLLLLKFSAKWCLPCRVMDEHVWTDPTLAAAVGTNCIAVAADIETLDGLALKQDFLVEKLPTTLLFDACGRVLVRFEAACSAGQILERINFFNSPENRFCPVDPRSIRPAVAALSAISEPAKPLFFLSQPVVRDFFKQENLEKTLVAREQDLLADRPEH